MLVGNKVDLVERNPKKREVSYDDGKQLVACVAGQIERVNKLITVRPVKSR